LEVAGAGPLAIAPPLAAPPFKPKTAHAENHEVRFIRASAPAKIGFLNAAQRWQARAGRDDDMIAGVPLDPRHQIDFENPDQ
jgi:hypothetical protein